MILENKETIFSAISADKGSPRLEMLFEFLPLFEEARLAISSLEDWAKPTSAPFKLMHIADVRRVQSEPVGTVLIIAPWNYPFMLSIQPVISALAAGCTVVLKPSEIAPNTAEVLEMLIAKYFHPGLLTVVQGGVTETTALLAERFDHIFYTGSSQIGPIIMKAAAKHLTPVTLEMGGKCPVIVLPDADIENTAHRIVWGKFLNCGQTCVAPDYVVVDPKIRKSFISAVKRCVNKFYGTSPRESTSYARIINEHHYRRLRGLFKSHMSTNPSTIVVVGGTFADDDPKTFFPPTVLENVTFDIEKNPVMREEIFGPILPIVEGTLDEALAFINTGDHPLALYVFTSNTKNIPESITKQTKSGGITINDVIVQVGMIDLPFGGVGRSGMGTYHGKSGFKTFSYERALVIRPMGWEFLHSLFYPPGTAKFIEKFEGTMKPLPTEGTLRFKRFIKEYSLTIGTMAAIALVFTAGFRK
ncbi:hypothetical protein HDU67_009384 [Dinochytrium kinnereticum]|nr:hypothetical protein HDU67_009384 [Dinochytrium kinnereticum]